jgi:hypothetical protein
MKVGQLELELGSYTQHLKIEEFDDIMGDIGDKTSQYHKIEGISLKVIK